MDDTHRNIKQRLWRVEKNFLNQTIGFFEWILSRHFRQLVNQNGRSRGYKLMQRIEYERWNVGVLIVMKNSMLTFARQWCKVVTLAMPAHMHQSLREGREEAPFFSAKRITKSNKTTYLFQLQNKSVAKFDFWRRRSSPLTECLGCRERDKYQAKNRSIWIQCITYLSHCLQRQIRSQFGLRFPWPRRKD